MEEINWKEILDVLKINTTNIIVSIITIVFVFAIAKLLTILLTRATSKTIKKAEKISDPNKSKEIITSMTVTRSVGRYIIYFFAIIVLIYHFGFGSELSNMVTAAGVGALVVSLGAQSIIKDVIAGWFIMFERQYGVGDYVKINEFEGTVTSLAMRCTYLNTWKGEKIIIPNGQITSVINYSGEFNMAIVEIPTPYEADTNKIVEILKDIANKYYEDNKNICYDKPDVVAINSFGESSVNVAIYLKAVKRNHIKIQRDLRMLIKERFDTEGISIPYNQIVIHEDK